MTSPRFTGMFSLDDRRSRGVLIGSLLLVAVAIASVLMLRDQKTEPTSKVGALGWFTTDDGKTWFADDRNRLPPFEKDGKQANGCSVWSTNGGKTKVVSNLYRFSEAGKRQLTEAAKNPKADLSALRWELMEIKRPGDKDWVKASTQGGEEMQVPQTSARDLEPVEP